MVTIVIDNWTIISIITPIMIITIIGLFITMMDYRTELQYTERQAELYEKYYHEYRSKYLSLQRKYERLKHAKEEED